MEEKPTFRRYAMTVLKRSITHWGGTDTWFAVLSYLAIALLALAGVGVIETTVGEAFEKVLAWVAIGWLTLLLIIITPYRMWAEEVSNKTSLEELLEPRISLRFEQGVCMHVRDGHHHQVRTFYVIVKNESRRTRLVDCHVDLISVHPSDNPNISLPLRSAHNRDHFPLSIGQEELITVCSLEEPNWVPPNGVLDETENFGRVSNNRPNGPAYNQNGLSFDKDRRLIPKQIQLHYGIDVTQRYIPQGRYFIKIKAFSIETEPYEMSLVIDMDGGQLTLREAMEDDGVTG